MVKSRWLRWSRAIVAVGGGRGFVIESRQQSFVVTAAHRLPHLPPSGSISYTEDRTYARLLGPLGGEQEVWAECLFVDPIADIAVLGSPDDQVLCEQAQVYDALIDAAVPLPLEHIVLIRDPVQIPAPPGYVREVDGDYPITISGPLSWRGSAWIMSLDGQWFPCDLEAGTRSMGVANAAGRVEGGMSGSPIVSFETGAAVGVLVTDHFPQPILSRNLPAWLLEELAT